MLEEISITDFALIEDSHVEFAGGFNVLSGPTGAGKSLVVGALAFLLGGRGKQDLLRKDAKAARVEARFRITNKRTRRRIEEILDVELDDGELILQRTLSSDGRNKARAAGVMAAVGTLAEIGEALVDVHSQREHQSLLKRSIQLEMLDAFGSLETERQAFAASLREYRDTLRIIEEKEASRDSLQAERELLEFQHNELEALGLAKGEEPELEMELKRLSSAEKIGELSARVYDRLYDSEESVTSMLSATAKSLDELSEFDAEMAAHRETIERASSEIADIAANVRARSENLEFDENRRLEIEERLGAIDRLCRKHRRDADGLVDLAAELKTRLDELGTFDENLDDLRKRARSLEKKAIDLGSKLTAAREKAGKTLAGKVEKELADLGMKGAGFEVSVEKASSLDGATASGPAPVEFRIKPNVGGEMKALSAIASGGELSRVMLALKTALAGVDRIGLLVFDEVDAGIGGRLGDVIGRKLAKLAKSRQVLSITHMPQIAAHAERHLKVEKTVKAGRTLTRVSMLEGEERVKEIAEMIRGGADSETTMTQAREMLGERLV